MSKAFGLLTGLMAILSGCAIFNPSGGMGPPTPVGEDLMVEIAKRVPAFGGLFYADGTLYVYLLGPTQKEAAEAAIREVYGPQQIPPNGIQVVQGQYSFLQLWEWQERLALALSPTMANATRLYLAVEKNRLRVELKTMAIASQVEDELNKLGIPQVAVIFEEGGAWPTSVDELYLEVVRKVPAFGSMFVNGDCLYVYLLDPTQKEQAEAAIRDIFGSEYICPEGIRVLQGQYSFIQLKEWKDRMSALWAIPGIVFIDIDDANNRLTVGVESSQAGAGVERELLQLGVPREAVIIERTGPIYPASDS